MRISFLLNIAILVCSSEAPAVVAQALAPTANQTSIQTSGVTSAPSPEQILLWPSGAPGATGTEDADRPSLAVYALAQKTSSPRSAVLVLPGGAYVALAKDHEGKQVAAWLNQRGVDAFVLSYRLSPRYHYPAPFLDATRAMRWIRSHAAQYNIDPAHIGVWGFSAGGHLASLIGTHYDAGGSDSSDPIERVSSRPDFLVLAYPVIEPLGSAAKFSYESLLGKNAPPALVEEMKTDLHVTADTPPAFLFHTDSDDGVLSSNSALFYLALKKAGVPAELHIYARGLHGVGLAPTDPVLGTWPQRLEDWMRTNSILPKP